MVLQVVEGGLCCQSGIAIQELGEPALACCIGNAGQACPKPAPGTPCAAGDNGDDMLIAVAAVTVGY